MFNFFANIFGYLLNYIYELVNNYGIAIIVFTVLLKLIMLPISIKQQKTMKKSAEMQVKVKEIQDKYKNDQVRQSQELMDLYKRENMSPFSGCLSSIIQIIIVISMFYLVSRPLTYMKHIDNNLLDSYSQTIQEKSGSRATYKEIAIIKEMSNVDENVKLNMNFLGLDLSDIPSQDYTDWKVFIIPVLYVFTSLVSTRLTMSLNKKTEENKDSSKEQTDKVQDSSDQKENSDQEDMMQETNMMMTRMMPIMTVSIALIAPLGLALYWLVSNILMIAERLFVNKFFKEEGEDIKNG